MLYLLDKSAHEIARREPAAQQAFETFGVTGLLATCAMVELEILYSARDRNDHARLKSYLREHCVWLETTDEIMLAALGLQEAMLVAGKHRKPLPDLIIAALARHHNAVVVHHDRDFDDIVPHLDGLRARWITRPASRKHR